MKRKYLRLLSIAVLVFSANTFAGDFEWSGVYRFEAHQLKNLELNSASNDKAYALHHLVLSPKIEAADGLTIRSRFDIFNNTTYPNSQLGAVWGNGVNNTATPGTSTENSSSLGDSQAAETFTVSQLYVTLVQEHGAFIAGRAPMHFGLGMVHNAGEGIFDHWYDNRDLVGYKFVLGNFFFFPMYAKVTEGSSIVSGADDITDQIFHLQYEKPDEGVEMGVIYQDRSGAQFGNDTPTALGTVNDRLSIKTYSLYGLKETEESRLGVEFAWQEGSYGVVNGGSSVQVKGTGVSFEYERSPADSKYIFGLQAGYATGDDPATTNSYEGFLFDKNYSVAMLMYNFAMGQANILGTGLSHSEPTAGTNSDFDVDTVSNTYYVSPYMVYKWNDRWDLTGRLTAGWLETQPIAGQNLDKSLGYELDLGFNFKPNKRVQWVNELGLMFAGDAYKAGTNNFDTSFAWGFISKAAISF